MKNNNPYIFITDLETTGFSPMRNDMIELAGIIAKKDDDGKYQKIATFNERCRPYSRESWTEGAEEAHKITLHEALGFQHPRGMLINFLNFMVPFKSASNWPLTFVFHGKNKFDFKFLMNAFMKEDLVYSFYKIFNMGNVESTYDLYSKYKHVLGLENLKLPTLAKYFDIHLDHHSAPSDANACFEIYKIVKEAKFGLGLFQDA